MFLYPSSDIWLVGHSLGGALASLLGSTFGLPAVAFESPGERLAAERLHLPMPPPLPGSSSTSFPVPITHVYHNSDPIPQGTCTGFASPCAQAGYALETHCHLGKSIVFDTVNRLGWRVDIRYHVIKNVILKVLEAGIDWEEDRKVPIAREEEDCVVRVFCCNLFTSAELPIGLLQMGFRMRRSILSEGRLSIIFVTPQILFLSSLAVYYTSYANVLIPMQKSDERASKEEPHLKGFTSDETTLNENAGYISIISTKEETFKFRAESSLALVASEVGCRPPQPRVPRLIRQLYDECIEALALCERPYPSV